MPFQPISLWACRAWLTVATILLTVTACDAKPETDILDSVPGRPIGSGTTACKGYLARADVKELLGDPNDLIDSGGITSSTFGSCGLYDPKQNRYTLRFDVANRNIGGEFDQQMKEGQARPGAIVQNKIAAAFPEPDGTEAKALILLPGTYVVVFLRQGPMTAERLTRLLAIAGKIAATVPAPFGTTKPTPTTTR
jgi:hypothetical protein